MAQKSRKPELIAQLAHARRGVSLNFDELRRDLDVRCRVKNSFRQHGFAWLGGASVLGFLVTRSFVRTRKFTVSRVSRNTAAEEKVVKAGLLVTVLKIAFDLARPYLTKWLARKVGAYAAERFGAAAR